MSTEPHAPPVKACQLANFTRAARRPAANEQLVKVGERVSVPPFEAGTGAEG